MKNNGSFSLNSDQYTRNHIFFTAVFLLLFQFILSPLRAHTNPATQIDVSGLCLFSIDTYEFAMDLGIEQEWAVSDTFSFYTRIEYLNNSYFAKEREHMIYFPVLIGVDIIDADWTDTVGLWGFVSIFAGYTYLDSWLKTKENQYDLFRYSGGAPEMDIRFQLSGIENKSVKFFIIAGYKIIYVHDTTAFTPDVPDGIPSLNKFLNGIYLGINCTYFWGLEP